MAQVLEQSQSRGLIEQIFELLIGSEVRVTETRGDSFGFFSDLLAVKMGRKRGRKKATKSGNRKRGRPASSEKSTVAGEKSTVAGEKAIEAVKLIAETVFHNLCAGRYMQDRPCQEQL